MSTVDSKRIRLYETDDLVIELEYGNGIAILHCPRCTRLNKSTYLKAFQLVKEWQEFIQYTGLKGLYAAAYDPQVIKLIEKLGFTYLGTQDNLKVYVNAPSTPDY